MAWFASLSTLARLPGSIELEWLRLAVLDRPDAVAQADESHTAGLNAFVGLRKLHRVENAHKALAIEYIGQGAASN